MFKHGDIRYDPATGKASGEIVFDATSGKTGNDCRDKKMHKDVIESGRFSEIAFRPDRADGTLAASGDSTLQVHGMFSIHGAEHEDHDSRRRAYRGVKLEREGFVSGAVREVGNEKSERAFSAGRKLRRRAVSRGRHAGAVMTRVYAMAVWREAARRERRNSRNSSIPVPVFDETLKTRMPGRTA